jgi:hypothetical protein
MAMTDQKAPTYRHLPGMVSGLVVWAVWFVAVYGLAGLGCERGWNEHSVPGGNLLSVTLLGTTAAALAAIGWCAVRGYVGWRSGRGRRGPGQEAQHRARFMGFVMFVLSLIAVVATVMIAIPMLMLDPCAA